MQANATYSKVTTDDGSPTVRVTIAGQPHEDMHHSGGALSESILIYSEIVRAALNFNLPPKIASVGLGLGYNEALAMAEIITFEQKRYDFLEKLLVPKRPEHVTPEIRILSFEKDPVIRENYVNWLHNRSSNSFWTPLFQEVLELVAARYGMPDTQLKREMNKLYKEERFKIVDDVQNFQENVSDRYSVILYDAFSNKSTPELWDEEFLKKFLYGVSEKFCFFSSYASLGGLNRALEATGYLVDVHRGFKNKRHATCAYRCAP